MMRRGIMGGERVDSFDKAFVGVDGNKQHNAYDADVANSFYNLATDFYEYGWGDSFHFGFRRQGEPHSRAILNSQVFVAQKLQVGDMARVLDMGCGIGGPLRSIVRLTGANVTGVTINQHQVNRGREICSKLTPYMQERCHFVREDYLDVKTLPENTYDAAFYMESSLHTEQRAKTFSETFRLLKPGGRLVAMEYNLLPGWQPENPEHQRYMQMHLHGNGAARTPTIEENLSQFRAAGFEVKEHFDFMGVGDKIYGEDVFPWWGDLQFNWRFQLLPAHPWVRRPLAVILKALSSVGAVPEDVYKAAELMNEGGDGLSMLGKLGAITPQYYVLAVKPLNAAK
jgi:sterol 24-C-methyltransferase